VTVSPPVAQVGATLACDATASDLDGEIPSIAYGWSDGTLGATLVVSAENSTPGEPLTCKATATDAAGAKEWLKSIEVPVYNTVPGTPSLSLSPSAPEAGEALTCAVSTPAFDADEEELTYEFSWKVDGVAYLLASTSDLHSVVPASDVGFDEEWICTVQAFDALTSGDPTSVTVTTAPPPDPAPGAQIWLDAAHPDALVGGLWNDLSGNDRDGTPVGNAVFDAENGGSFAFDGTADYVDFAASTSYNSVSDFSVGLWFSPSATVSPASLTVPQMLFEAQDTRYTSSNPDNYLYLDTTGNLLFRTWTPTNNVLSTQTTWNAGQWYYIVATYQASTGTKSLYVDGELDASTAEIWSNYFNTYTHFGLGAYDAGSSWSFAGGIAMFHLYHRTLSAAEVDTNYDATRARFGT
jgi:hypothetical protein